MFRSFFSIPYEWLTEWGAGTGLSPDLGGLYADVECREIGEMSLSIECILTSHASGLMCYVMGHRMRYNAGDGEWSRAGGRGMGVSMGSNCGR